MSHPKLFAMVLLFTVSCSYFDFSKESLSSKSSMHEKQSSDLCAEDIYVRSPEWIECSSDPNLWGQLNLETGPVWRTEDRASYSDVYELSFESATDFLGTNFFTKNMMDNFLKKFLEVNMCENCETIQDLDNFIQIKGEASGHKKSTIQTSDGRYLTVYSKHRSYHLGVDNYQRPIFVWAEAESSQSQGKLPSFSGDPTQGNIDWNGSLDYLKDLYCVFDADYQVKTIGNSQEHVRLAACSEGDQT